MEKSGHFSKTDIDSINEALVGLEKPLTNLKIFIAAKSLNEALLKKIEEKELSQKQNVNVDESLIIEKPMIVGKSDVLKEAVELADKVASQDVNVLFQVERELEKKFSQEEFTQAASTLQKLLLLLTVDVVTKFTFQICCLVMVKRLLVSLIRLNKEQSLLKKSIVWPYLFNQDYFHFFVE